MSAPDYSVIDILVAWSLRHRSMAIAYRVSTNFVSSKRIQRLRSRFHIRSSAARTLSLLYHLCRKLPDHSHGPIARRAECETHRSAAAKLRHREVIYPA